MSRATGGRDHCRRLLAGAALVGLLLAAPPALADGGAGAGTGGTGGTTSATGAGGAGGNGSIPGGGGGGGAGVSGGGGGTGGGGGGGAGGAGGSTAGASGATGLADPGNGGGGGGGAHGAVVNTTTTNSATLTGGNGGAGGGATGDGGGGGAGGYGVVINGSGLTYTNSGGVMAGSGGDGGGATGNGGDGGDGGIGVFLTGGSTLVNSGSITGGSGGAGGVGFTSGSAGTGGAGIVGGGLSIINSGAITGGLGGDGVTRANAITFTGGTNTLTLQSGSSITGNVVAFSAADTLALGGSTNASFNMSNIGAAAQYQGFGVFQKTGSSTWTLTGTAGTATSWTVTGGLLNFSSTSAFNGGTLTLNGGGLQWASGTSTDISSSLAALGAGGATFDTNGNNVTFGTGLSGTGALTKSGSGTLTLSIANTYSGGTDVEAGTLQLSGPGTLGSSSGSVTVSGGTLDLGGTSQIVGALSGSGGAIALGSGALTVNQSTSTSYAGAISGTGSLTKSGTGTLILDGVNTYTGGTTVTAGALEIGDASTPGASLAGAVTVGASGTLMGHGAIGGNVMNIAGGIVSPGGTIGTLTVSGNYTQGASSTLSIEASPTAASKLLVGGSASLAGTLALVYDPGVYTGKSFTILSAGSIAGTFSTITSNAASIVQTLAYGPTSVDLSSFGSFAIAPTADTAFTALGTAALEGAQQSNSLLLGHLANPQSGGNIESGAASPPATQATQLAFNGGAEQLSQVVAALPAAMSQLGGWFRGLGEFDHLSGSASMPGFTTQAGGFLAGIDRPVADHLIAGIAAGYGHTDLSQGDGERGKIDTPRLALYGSDDLGAWALDGTIGYGYDRIAATRAIAALGATAISNHDGHEANAALQARTRLIAGGIAVTPAAGLQYTHLFETAFTESGASGFDLSVAKRNSDSLRPFLGVSAEESFTTANGTMLTPEADLAYSHELFNTPPSLVAVGGGSFSVDGLTPSRDALTLGGSVSAAMNDRLDLYAAYHATLPTGNLLAQTVEAGVTYKF